MNKKDLVDNIAQKMNVSKSIAESALESVFDVIAESISKGEKVTLAGFGTFSKVQRGERKGRNPKTGLEMVIPSKSVASFKPGKSLKELVS